jgi:5'-3' exonuclease
MSGCEADEPVGRLDRFVAHLQSTIARKVREYDTPVSNLVFLMDCPRGEIWRRRVLPEYKATRGEKGGFDTRAFEAAVEQVVKPLQAQGAVVLAHPHSEADDLAAGVARWAKACDSSVRMVIVTGDSDFLQLATERVHIHTIYGDCALARLACGDPRTLLLRKLLMGDKSDNIPAIRPRMGPKATDHWLEEGVETLLADDPDARANFERNRTLIDLQCAPEDILSGIDAVVLAAFTVGLGQRMVQSTF